jgi:hypothetical protein
MSADRDALLLLLLFYLQIFFAKIHFFFSKIPTFVVSLLTNEMKHTILILLSLPLSVIPAPEKHGGEKVG